MSDKDPLSSLDEEGRSRISRMFSGCAEVVGVEHVASVISGDPSHSGDDQLVAYIGLEPSGKAHVAYMLLADAISSAQPRVGQARQSRWSADR